MSSQLGPLDLKIGHKTGLRVRLMSSTHVHERSHTVSSVERTAEVFDKYGGFIRAVIRFHVKDETEAEDLFQDLFLLLASKPIPPEVQNVKCYLYKVISDTSKDAFRRIERYQTRVRRYAERNARTIETRPDGALVEAEEKKKMFELIEKRLPPPQALAVTLRFRDDYDTDQVAERMRIKPRTVSRYVSVGLDKLRCSLGEEQRVNR
ncbi:MAG: RNA polymerase sigma factor [Planctomycetota bacterium]